VPPEGSAPDWTTVLSRREARLLFGRAMTAISAPYGIAGIIDAFVAIPTAAAILAITDYLRQCEVLLRADATGHEA
jgi:hypothetical protein